jgi:hypothetical protein
MFNQKPLIYRLFGRLRQFVSLSWLQAAVVYFDGARARLEAGRLRRSTLASLEIELRKAGCMNLRITVGRKGKIRFSQRVRPATREAVGAIIHHEMIKPACTVVPQ